MLKSLIKLLPKTLSDKLFIISWGYRLLTRSDSYLVTNGYAKSYLEKQPVDADGNPLPWMNYAIIDLLKERLTGNEKVFEYGSGYSSLFLSKLCKEVYSVEYDKAWHHKVEQLLATNNASNVSLIYCEVVNGYENTVAVPNKTFDLVIIDGRKRLECAKAALDYLSPQGVVLLDDSDRSEYAVVFDLYKQRGYKNLKIKGIKPTGFATVQSTIFYKEENVLDI